MNGMEIEFDIGTSTNRYKYIELINTGTLPNYTPLICIVKHQHGT